MSTDGTTQVLDAGAPDARGREVASYVTRVRAALADLGPEEVDDLTGGMEADLGELLAERGGPLERVLGDPSTYAEELRAAAGLPGAPATARTLDVGAWWRRRRGALDAAVDARPWLRPFVDTVASLRPAWWLVRAFLATVALVWFRAGGFIPSLEYHRTSLIVGTLLLAVLSVWLGRRRGPDRDTPSGRLISGLLVTGFAVASVMGVVVLSATPVAQPVFVDNYSGGGQGVVVDGRPAGGLYRYDSQGRPLTGVRVYDDAGHPVVVSPDFVPGSVTTTRPVDVYGSPYGNVYPLPVPTPVDGSAPWSPPASIVPLATPTGGVTVTTTTTVPAPTTTAVPSTTSSATTR